MDHLQYTLTVSDGVRLHCNQWTPQSQPRALLHINHGMAEHSFRYGDLAAFLTDKGIAVVAQDHRGHGKTAPNKEALGFFSETRGWSKVVDDGLKVSQDIRMRFPDLPLFVLGHSMGSFLVRSMMMVQKPQPRGYILSGTGGKPGFLGLVGLKLAQYEVKKQGARHVSTKLDSLVFGKYNKKNIPLRTSLDWVSSDPEQVDIYLADPFCGFTCTAKLFEDLFYGVLKVNSPEFYSKVDPETPVYLFAGGNDPVGKYGEGVEDVFQKLRKAGVRDVGMKLYPEGRHEMINEVNRVEVYNDIWAWVEAHLP